MKARRCTPGPTSWRLDGLWQVRLPRGVGGFESYSDVFARAQKAGDGMYEFRGRHTMTLKSYQQRSRVRRRRPDASAASVILLAHVRNILLHSDEFDMRMTKRAPGSPCIDKVV